MKYLNHNDEQREFGSLCVESQHIDLFRVLLQNKAERRLHQDKHPRCGYTASKTPFHRKSNGDLFLYIPV